MALPNFNDNSSNDTVGNKDTGTDSLEYNFTPVKSKNVKTIKEVPTEKKVTKKQVPVVKMSARNKKTVIASGGMLLVAGLLFGGGYALYNAGMFTSTDSNTNTTGEDITLLTGGDTEGGTNSDNTGTKDDTDAKDGKNSNDRKKIEWWKDENTKYPDGYKPLNVVAPVNGQLDLPEIKAIQDRYGVSGVNTVAQNFPLMDSSTENVTEAKDSDGNFNPLFSYWNKENFLVYVGSAIQCFIDPVYGGWVGVQYGDTTVPANMKPLFTPGFLKANEGKPLKDWLPVYGPWVSKDYYEGLFIPVKAGNNAGIPLYWGHFDNVNASLEDNSKVKLVVDAVFSAWGEKKEQVNKRAKITLTIVPNPANSDTNRYLISEAKIEAS